MVEITDSGPDPDPDAPEADELDCMLIQREDFTRGKSIEFLIVFVFMRNWGEIDPRV